MSAYMIENMVQYDLSPEDVTKLEGYGFVVECDEYPDKYDTTAFVWNDLGLEGDRAYDLFDAILGRREES